MKEISLFLQRIREFRHICSTIWVMFLHGIPWCHKVFTRPRNHALLKNKGVRFLPGRSLNSHGSELFRRLEACVIGEITVLHQGQNGIEYRMFLTLRNLQVAPVPSHCLFQLAFRTWGLFDPGSAHSAELSEVN